MRTFNYSAIREQKWDSDVLGLIAAIYKEAGKQELYLKQRPEELEKLVEIAKIQSTEASNAIEGIVTTSTRIRQLVEEKTTPEEHSSKFMVTQVMPMSRTDISVMRHCREIFLTLPPLPSDSPRRCGCGWGHSPARRGAFCAGRRCGREWNC